MVGKCHIAYIAMTLLLYLLQKSRAVQIREKTFHLNVSGSKPEYANTLANNTEARTICLLQNEPSWSKNRI